MPKRFERHAGFVLFKANSAMEMGLWGKLDDDNLESTIIHECQHIAFTILQHQKHPKEWSGELEHSFCTIIEELTMRIIKAVVRQHRKTLTIKIEWIPV